MQIRLENLGVNAASFMRSCGYAFERNDGRESSFMRRLAGRDYPRFHAYTHMADGVLVVNLHLDQKKPSYDGASAHSGEYDGELVETEAERIKKCVGSRDSEERITEF
ncbi:MAG: hypothetical protein HYV66_01920 [Candidatus Sungbacteria bacterium]|uniref:Uncharacterized protein n=1 Tax=Candidatus Sungiibacteriota bacterium TaxID=2750080 RepID=A0A931YDQ2_9BACT|nr:hypothetical protein [Candidatus Sungbacteria bacterium]MBI2465967.1 hypothetical protein [Candidatus Sungbacteria bacterium]